MTTFDRIEPRLPELLDELAAGSPSPEYLDVLLWQTAHTPQKPAWASLERWLPMVASVQTLSSRLAPARSALVLAALLILALVAALVIGSGAFQTRVPPPFGPARNGTILYSTQGGDIVALDPTSGRQQTLIGGTTIDRGPFLSRDGRKFLFLRAAPGGTANWIANVDGTGARELVPAGHDFTSVAWAPSGDRVAFVERRNVVIVDVANGALTTIPFHENVGDVTWRPGSNQLIVTTPAIDEAGATRSIYVIDAVAGATPRELVVDAHVISAPDVAPDGSAITYTTWDDGVPGMQGRIHLLDLATGVDRLLTADLDDGYLWEDARFSPDGKWIVSEMYGPGPYFSLTLVSVSDSKTRIVLGPAKAERTGGAYKTFTPDGKALLARYNADGEVWLLPTDGSAATRLDWPEKGIDFDEVSWQRLAP